LERSRRQGNATALDHKPELYDDLVFYWNAFTVLNARRGLGGAIGISDIIAYGSVLGVGDMSEFVELIVLIDNTFTDVNQKLENKGGSESGREDSKSRS
jgi:hypothetical protein